MHALAQLMPGMAGNAPSRALAPTVDPRTAIDVLRQPMPADLALCLTPVATTTGGTIITPSPALVAAAEHRLAHVAAALLPAPRKVVVAWLYSLAAVSERPPEGGRLEDQVEALAGMLELPAAAFTRETLAAVAKANKWFPGFGRLVETLTPLVEPVRREQAHLADVIRIGTTPPPKPPVDREALKAHVAATLAALKAEQQQASPPPPVKPSHLTREQLAAAYASAGLVGPRKAG